MTGLKGCRIPRQDRSRQSLGRVLEGVKQLTLASVSQRAGGSTGSIYGRVRGREELFDGALVSARIGEGGPPPSPRRPGRHSE